MSRPNFLEPCTTCKRFETCPVPKRLASVQLAWTVPDAIFDYPFVDVVSSWRQDDSLLIKLQCNRYDSTQKPIFQY
jgi:hypothetical protein